MKKPPLALGEELPYQAFVEKKAAASNQLRACLALGATFSEAVALQKAGVAVLNEESGVDLPVLTTGLTA